LTTMIIYYGNRLMVLSVELVKNIQKIIFYTAEQRVKSPNPAKSEQYSLDLPKRVIETQRSCIWEIEPNHKFSQFCSTNFTVEHPQKTMSSNLRQPKHRYSVRFQKSIESKILFILTFNSSSYKSSNSHER
jgi:hypothetical protein